MRRSKMILLLIALTIFLISFPVYSLDDITVTVDGEKLVFDVAPVIKNERILLPLRSLFEVLGAEVSWDAETKRILGKKGSTEIIAAIDQKAAVVNGSPLELDISPLIINGRTFVPARFIAESLGANVSWHNETRTMAVVSNSPFEFIRYNILQNNLVKAVDEERINQYLDLANTADYSERKYLDLEKQLIMKYKPITFDNGKYYGPRANGKGVYIWNTGERYIGDWKDTYRTGKGVYYWPDGTKYIGDWKLGQMDGAGIYSFLDGQYHGQWKNQKRNGYGIFLHNNGNKRLGLWENDEEVGVSINYWTNRNKYIGEWDRDYQLNGNGIFYYDNGDAYVGSFKKGSRDTGKYILKDGLVYIGAFDENGSRANGSYLVSKDGEILDIQKKCAEIINSVTNHSMTLEDKEKELHKYLVLNTKYDEENEKKNRIPEEAYTAFGVFQNNTAVCQGYAEAMNYLLNKIGIESIIVVGTAGNGNEPDKWEGHAWNIVKLNGRYYHLDVTWDDPDQGNTVSQEFFNVKDDYIRKTHKWDIAKYPQCQ